MFFTSSKLGTFENTENEAFEFGVEEIIRFLLCLPPPKNKKHLLTVNQITTVVRLKLQLRLMYVNGELKKLK